jgi:hypothetical protein
MKKIETTLPFMGFYNSVHSENIDREIESAFDIEGSGLMVYVPDEFWIHYEFKKAYIQYAIDYVRSFEKELNDKTQLDIDLYFKELISPRYYNYSTDVITVEISESDWLKLHEYVLNSLEYSLMDELEKAFKSRSGFISFYDHDIESLPANPIEFDCNEIGVFMNTIYREFGDDWEFYAVEECHRAFGSGLNEECVKLLDAFERGES